MNPPICRACGARHWGREHVWPRSAKQPRPRQNKADRGALNPDDRTDEGDEGPLAPQEPTLAPDPPTPVEGEPQDEATDGKAQSDRKAYMRRYQRDYRAKRRAERKLCT